ncbi:hypothetical protein BGX34_009773 [Mortierella sp. NVP85]|nr:hypothetical protein BGX34_009773 [Mortierella sp. NVP85]
MTPLSTNAPPGTTTTLPTTSTATAAAAVTVSSTAPGRPAVSVSSSEHSLQLPTHIHHTQPSHKRTQAHAQAPLTPRAQTPLSAQEWQGLVASGALPVRQALHSFIATSCEKPPETKEEARAVLEVMFQIRAGKIRRAIEEGKLSTTEALQHRVIQRRESVVEGTLKNSFKGTKGRAKLQKIYKYQL